MPNTLLERADSGLHARYDAAVARLFSWRLLFELFIPAALLVVGGAWFIAQDRIDEAMDMVRAEEINIVVLAVRRIDGELSRPLSQLRVLVNEEVLQRALDADERVSLEVLNQRLRSLLAYNPEYDKMRWLDEQGMERLRVGRVEGQVVTMPSEQLQNQADSYYFRNAARLQPGQIYISPLDLNVEHGKVEIPHKPVLRIATPVQNSNEQARGVLIFDVAASHMLDGFTESVGNKRDHVMLVNQHGYWLKSSHPSDDWGFMFKREETLASRFPEAWREITALPTSQIKLADGLWTWSTAYPLKVDAGRDISNIPAWLVISHLPEARLAWIYDGAWKSVGAGAATLLILFGGLAFLLVLAVQARHRAQVAEAKAHGEALAAQRIAEANERFRMVVEANANGLLVVDAAGRIVMTNPALSRMFGYADDELIGQAVEVLLPPAKGAGHEALRQAYFRAPEPRAMGIGRELLGRRKDGSVFPVEISLSPFTENGEPYTDAIVADISGRKHD
jgi:PAS domain S-box-containing protein